MKLPLVGEGLTWTGGALLAGALLAWIGEALGSRAVVDCGWCLAVVGGLFMLYFFRDPDRHGPKDPTLAVSGADGLVRNVEEVREDRFLKCDAVRISVFLSPFDVHVNRIPIAGTVKALDYQPGRHMLTIQNASSNLNEQSAILIEGQGTRCLARQIVGPIVRRVVYWLTIGQTLAKGDRIGMMKFGSRLDVYFPREDVEVLVKKGERVVAGLTPIARIKTMGGTS